MPETLSGDITPCSLDGELNPTETLSGLINYGIIYKSDKTYEYTQGVASSEWTVCHNLDKYPSISVVDSAGNQVEGDVLYVDKNNVVLTFTAAFSGAAYFN